jgi:hypothetical protein
MGDHGGDGAKTGLQVAAIVVLALFAGFVLVDLVGMLTVGRDKGIAIGQIFWRIAIIALCVASIASIVPASWPGPGQNRRPRTPVVVGTHPELVAHSRWTISGRSGRRR